MNKRLSPSYEDMRSEMSFWVEVIAVSAGINETVDPAFIEIDHTPITTRIFYETRVKNVCEGGLFPWQSLRIDVIQQTRKSIANLKQKYPVGLIEIWKPNQEWDFDGEPLVNISATPGMVSHMIATFSQIRFAKVEFLISLPVLPVPLPDEGIFPVLNYIYRVYATAE